MEKTVKKRQNKSQPPRIISFITAAFGIGRARKRRAAQSYQGSRFGKSRRNKGAFGKCKYLRREKE